MISISSFLKERRGTTLAGVFGLALSSVLLLCGAGLTPSGTVLESDLNANGHNLTNAATVSATNVAVTGTLTAPSSFTLPLAKVTGSLAGDVAGTPGATTVGKINGTTIPSASSTALGNAPNGAGGFPTYATSDESLTVPNAINAQAGPAGPYTLCAIGDSITEGVNSTNPNQMSYPGVLVTLPFFSNAYPLINLGFPSHTTANFNTYYNNSGVSTTATWSNNAYTMTVASASGISVGMGIGSTAMAMGNKVTGVSGTTITVANQLFTNQSSVPVSFATPFDTTYINWTTNTAKTTFAVYPGCAHLCSPAVTGTSGYLTIMSGVNDVPLGTVPLSETGTISGTTISSLASTTGVSAGWLAFVGNVNIGTVSSTTSSSVTLSSITGGFTGSQTIVLTAPLSTSTTPYAALVTKALADSWTQIFLFTVLPTYQPTGANCNGYDILLNNWIKATYGGAAFGGSSVAGVTVIDTASMPQFASGLNPLYQSATDGVHPTTAGYQAIASFVNDKVSRAFPASLTTPIYHGGRYGVQDWQLTSDVIMAGDTRVPFLNQGNTFTGSVQTIQAGNNYVGWNFNNSGAGGKNWSIFSWDNGVSNPGQFTVYGGGRLNVMSLDSTVNSLTVPSDFKLGFSSTTDSGGMIDTYFTRQSAGVFGSHADLQFTVSGGGIVGTATNDNANAGRVGETISNAIASGSAVSLTTATTANVTSVSLTAGDWDVAGNVNFSASGATVTGAKAGLSSTSATVPSDGTECYSAAQLTTATATDTISVPRKRFSLSGTTTIYLPAQATFSAGSVGAFGSITARRVR